MNRDKITECISKSINILFISNPKRTSMGVLLGVIINTLKDIFTPLLKTIKYIDVQAVSVYNSMILGVFFVNLPIIFKSEKFTPEIEKSIIFIKEAKKNGKISDSEVRKMYRNLYDTLLGEIKLADTKSKKSNNEKRNTKVI